MLGVHEKIRAVRRSKNISQENIALELGITQSHYSKIENGKVEIKMSNFCKLQTYLKLM
jgi:transcriptional regulator with XRE-family HTH domain